MSGDLKRVEELWARYLSGGALSESEKEELLAAFSQDSSFRDDLLKDEGVDGALRALGRSRRDGKLFATRFADHIDAEGDRTRFALEVRRKIEGGGSEREASPSAEVPPRPRSTRRRFRQEGRRQGGTAWKAGLAAAAVFVVAILLLTLSSPRQTPSGESPAALPRPRKNATELSPGERMKPSEEARKPPEDRPAPRGPEPERPPVPAEKRPEQPPAPPPGPPPQPPKEPPRVPAPPPAPETPKDTVPGRPRTLAAVAVVERSEDAHLRVGDVRTPLKAGDEILPAQGLEVSERGTAVLVFPDKTRIHVWSDADVREFKAEGGKRLYVAKGTVRALVTKQPAGEPLIIATPHGEAKVLGTTLRIVVDPDPRKGTRLEVEEGKVQLKRASDQKTADITSGHVAVAAVGVDLAARRIADGRPAPWKPLPGGGKWNVSFDPSKNVFELSGTTTGPTAQGARIETDEAFDLAKSPVCLAMTVTYDQQDPKFATEFIFRPEGPANNPFPFSLSVLISNGDMTVGVNDYAQALGKGQGWVKAGQPLALEVFLDAKTLKVVADGRTLFSGVHGLTELRMVRSRIAAFSSGSPVRYKMRLQGLSFSPRRQEP